MGNDQPPAVVDVEDPELCIMWSVEPVVPGAVLAVDLLSCIM